jgi:hypothetical protein
MKFEKVNPATSAAAPGFSRSSDKYSKNQWSGHSNDGRAVDMGRGPTKGNDGTCGHAGYAKTGKMPPTAALPAVSKGKDMFTGTAQYRGQGGTQVKKPAAGAKIDMGRGPTMGNCGC